MGNLVPLLFLSGAAGKFYFALQVPLFRCHFPSYIPHSQGAAIAITLEGQLKGLNELLVSPMIENEVSRLA
jgi:hypothetical protein